MKSQEIGKSGENLARQHLIDAGHQMLRLNYKKGRGEIDIVSLDGDTLVFTEVKTRSYNNVYSAAEAIDIKKQERLRDAAMHYLTENKWNGECRFDAILVFASNLEHIKNAF